MYFNLIHKWMWKRLGSEYWRCGKMIYMCEWTFGLWRNLTSYLDEDVAESQLKNSILRNHGDLRKHRDPALLYSFNFLSIQFIQCFHRHSHNNLKKCVLAIDFGFWHKFSVMGELVTSYIWNETSEIFLKTLDTIIW